MSQEKDLGRGTAAVVPPSNEGLAVQRQRLTHCPTCTSPSPRWHPATQAGGEVSWICDDLFHEPLSELDRTMLAAQTFRAQASAGGGDHTPSTATVSRPKETSDGADTSGSAATEKES